MQIDESYFGVKTKYGRGWRMHIDTAYRDELQAQDELRSQLDLTNDDAAVGQVHGPWFFGLYQNVPTV